ncbi:X-linked retinitis pigmentosa GTPase regulator, partial [Eufriesea mexicana]
LHDFSETGAVFTIGRSRFADNVASHFFIRRDPVVSIKCGDEHSAVICQSGRLFVFGSNDWGQLGLGHKNHISKPSCVKALKPEKVTHVACGRAHTLICTAAQKIFACGSDQEGQLGRGTSALGDCAYTPVLVYDSGLAGSKVVQISAGSHHSLALTSDGGVFAWGSNLEGQLGLPDVSGLVNKPTKVHIPEPVKHVSAGYFHSTFLTESGLVYVCGESESGKLGIDVSFSTQVAPKQMQLPSPAIHVACGGHHTVILAENGNLYCTGSNSSGQLGLGTNFMELQTPKLLPRGALRNENITGISCGESHTAVVTDCGNLYTCGDGRHGKLGLEENENNVHELTFVSRYKELFVSHVACGGCHTILVGQRRDTNNRMQMDNSQMEHVQKRNSLPPLKLPVNRLQNETRDEHVNEINKDRSISGKEGMDSITNIQETMETSPEKIEENIMNNENIAINSITNSVNKMRKSVSPRKDDKESSEMKMNDENDAQTEKTSEQSNEENNNEMAIEVMEINIENEEINKENNEMENKDATDNMETNSEDVKPDSTENKMESNDGDVSKENASPEKQMSPTDTTPPPKPPRLKPGSGNSTTERSSLMEEGKEENKVKNEGKIEDPCDKKAETEENESGKKEESGSVKSSSKSRSSKSIRSKVDAEDMIEVDEQNDKDKNIQEEEMDNDNAQDDADVVQSPPPRTGKMSKIFKSKKSLAMENGTKATGTANQKSKVYIA